MEWDCFILIPPICSRICQEAHSFPRATLSGNCSLLGTDNVRGQISEHISASNGGYCFIQEAERANPRKPEARIICQRQKKYLASFVVILGHRNSSKNIANVKSSGSSGFGGAISRSVLAVAFMNRAPPRGLLKTFNCLFYRGQ